VTEHENPPTQPFGQRSLFTRQPQPSPLETTLSVAKHLPVLLSYQSFHGAEHLLSGTDKKPVPRGTGSKPDETHFVIQGIEPCLVVGDSRKSPNHPD
jgi:hypothetical protein